MNKSKSIKSNNNQTENLKHGRKTTTAKTTGSSQQEGGDEDGELKSPKSKRERTSRRRSSSSSDRSSDSSGSSQSGSSDESSSSDKDLNASDEDVDSKNQKGTKNGADVSKKLKTQLEKYKSSLRKDQHRLEKIERALQKAKMERNKTNEHKCKKYELKYRKKVSEHKAKIESIEKKLAKEQKKPASAGASTKSSNQVLPQPQPQPQPLPQPQPQPVIKLPFPVLNDRRDKNTIYRTLETKLNELMRKKSANISNMDGLERLIKTTTDRRAILAQLDKLKQLDANYTSQQEKLIKQLEYIRLSIQIDELRASAAMTGGFQEIPLIARMSQDLSEIFNYMKNENRMYLKNQKASLAGADRDQSPPPSSAPEKVESPTKALTATYESVCKSLVAVLAHTAACAHATAAINVYTQSYYAYLQEQQKKNGDESEEDEAMPPRPPPLPLKKELENASHTFEKYKSKISSFFMNTKKLETLSKKLSAQSSELTALNKLVLDYGDDDEDDDDDNEKEKEETNIPKENDVTVVEQPAATVNASQQVVEKSDDEESEEDDSWETDLDSRCDLEIVTTSELKSGQSELGRHFLLPSLKSTYFPLKASLDYSCVQTEGARCDLKELIGLEKSKGALTFMGPIGSISKADCKSSKRSSLKSILFGDAS